MKSGVLAGHPLRWSPRLTTSMVISSLKSRLREHLNGLNMLLSFTLICNLIALRSENVFWMMAILKTWWQNRTKQTNPLLMINQPRFKNTWNNACVFWGVLTAVSSWGSTRLGPVGEGVEFSQTCLSEDWRLGLPPPASGVTRGVLASWLLGCSGLSAEWDPVGTRLPVRQRTRRQDLRGGAGQAWGDSRQLGGNLPVSEAMLAPQGSPRIWVTCQASGAVCF